MDGDAVRSEMSDEMRIRSAELMRQVAGLDAIRARIDSGRIDPVGLSEEFARAPDALYRLLDALSPGNDLSFYRQSRSVVAVDQTMNLLSRERALATGPLALNSPMTASELRTFTRLVGSRTFLMEQALPELEPSLRAPFSELIASSPYARFTALEHRLLTGERSRPPQWRPRATRWTPPTSGRWRRSAPCSSSGPRP